MPKNKKIVDWMPFPHEQICVASASKTINGSSISLRELQKAVDSAKNKMLDRDIEASLDDIVIEASAVEDECGCLDIAGYTVSCNVFKDNSNYKQEMKAYIAWQDQKKRKVFENELRVLKMYNENVHKTTERIAELEKLLEIKG